MSKFHIKGSGQQTRRPPRDAASFLDEWIVGYYGGYYDILYDGGALQPDDSPAFLNNDPIRTLPQLLTNGTAEDLVFMSYNSETGLSDTPGQMYFRRDIRSQNGTKRVRKPMAFYPKDVFTIGDGADVGSGMIDGVLLAIPQGGLGVPAETPVLEYTTGLYGMKMLHELGLSGAQLTELESEMPESILPVPINPGTLIIRVRMQPGEVFNVPTIDYFLNGVLQPDGASIINPSAVNPAVGLDISQWLRMFAMPCWAAQKIFTITRYLDDAQIAQLHDVMDATSEDYR